jgi:NAD(P)-dependent dehydrogenase (short-subunit alcohol dehydrogenase family)
LWYNCDKTKDGVEKLFNKAFDDQDASENYLRLIPMGRYGEPEEIAGIAYFLTTPDAGFITGQAIVADGGQMAFMDWKKWLGRGR